MIRFYPCIVVIFHDFTYEIKLLFWQKIDQKAIVADINKIGNILKLSTGKTD